MGIIQKFKESQAKRKERKNLKQFASMFESIAKLFDSSLLVFDAEKHQLYIHNTLADVMLAKGPDGWQHFIENVYMSLAYQQMSGNWEKYFREQEEKAVAKARQQNPKLSLADEQRIRRAARDEVKKDDMGRTVPMEMSFVIIYDRGNQPADIVAVGHYDAATETMDMEEWSRVKAMVNFQNKKPVYGNTIRKK